MRTLAAALSSPAAIALLGNMEGYELIGQGSRKEDVAKLADDLAPDVLVAQAGLAGQGDAEAILVEAKRRHPDMRIIYFAGQGAKDKLEAMAKAGIWDICTDAVIDAAALAGAVKNPKSRDEIFGELGISEPAPEFSVPEQVSDGYANVILVTSMKPGSGKSFVATNMAAAIAEWGVEKRDGKRPQVAIVEGDLQTLSVGTLLGCEGQGLWEAVEAASGLLDGEGCMTGDEAAAEAARRRIRGAFVRCRQSENLWALSGEHIPLARMEEINPTGYYAMVEMISGMFDVVVVDGNSSFEHRTTGPMLDLARKIYCIMDLDANNIMNNVRYRGELERLGALRKVKYVLNKDIPGWLSGTYAERLEEGAASAEEKGFGFISKIPVVDASVVYNRALRKQPLILDSSASTFEARKAIFKIAADAYPISFMEDLRLEMKEREAGAKALLDETEKAGGKRKKKRGKMFGPFRRGGGAS